MTPSALTPALMARYWDRNARDELGVLASADYQVLLDGGRCPRCGGPEKELSFDLLLNNGLLVRWLILRYCVGCRDFVFEPVDLGAVAAAVDELGDGPPVGLAVERIYGDGEHHQFLDGHPAPEPDEDCARCGGALEVVRADLCLRDVPHLLLPYQPIFRCRDCRLLDPAGLDEALDALVGPLELAALHPSVYHDIPRYPTMMQWEVTTRCAQRCSYCPHAEVHGDGGRDSTLEEFLAAFERLNAKRTLRYVEFSGLGEPLEHPALLRMTRHCADQGIEHVAVVTSGTRMSPDRFADICEAGIGDLVISIDSLQPERMRALRGIDLAALLAGIEGLLEFQRRTGRDAPLLRFRVVAGRDTPTEDVAALAAWSRERGMLAPHVIPLESHAGGAARYYQPATRARVPADGVETVRAAYRAIPAVAEDEVLAAQASYLDLPDGDTRLRWVPHLYCGPMRRFVGLGQDGRSWMCPQGALGKPALGRRSADTAVGEDFWQSDELWRFRFAHANRVVPRYCADCHVLVQIARIEDRARQREGGRIRKGFIGRRADDDPRGG